MISTLIFDLDDTLLDRTGLWKSFCFEWIQTHAKELPSQTLEFLIEGLIIQHAEGTQSPEQLWAWLKENDFPQQTRMRSDHQFWNSFQTFLEHQLHPDPSLQNMLRQLRKQYLLAMITNGSSSTQRRKLRNTQLEPFFQRIWISEECGMEKPSTELFQTAVHELGREPSQVLMIGDDPLRDIHGAASAGLKTCWLSHGRTFPEHLAPPDWTLPSLQGLPTLLEDLVAEVISD